MEGVKKLGYNGKLLVNSTTIKEKNNIMWGTTTTDAQSFGLFSVWVIKVDYSSRLYSCTSPFHGKWLKMFAVSLIT